jgi:hypothetical protein
MVIDIDLRAAPPTVQLIEPEDFGAFKIIARAPAADREHLEYAVERLGRLTAGGHVFVDVTAVKGLAGERATEPRWLASLDGMLQYAGAHGWTDDAGAIRAHVEWSV